MIDNFDIASKLKTKWVNTSHNTTSRSWMIPKPMASIKY